MCMKKNNNRLLRGVAAVLCLALMFLTMSGMAMATDMEDAPAGGRTHRNRLPRRLKRRKRRSRRWNTRWMRIFRQAGTTRR